ncbi:MAG: hypothetical protein Q8P42_11995, partial [Gallionella sp.]|nr:hypothetical protein [Gallionella sp.]
TNHCIRQPLTRIIHWGVGRASARHVGLKPDLQPIDFAISQELMNYLGLTKSAIRERPVCAKTKTLHENNNAALMRRYVSAYGKPISSAIEY